MTMRKLLMRLLLAFLVGGLMGYTLFEVFHSLILATSLASFFGFVIVGLVAQRLDRED